MVASPCCLIEHDSEVIGQSGRGPGEIEETTQLRMMLVTPRPSLQHLLRKQRFPPERHQTLHVKVPWMNRPETHSILDQGNSSIVMSR